MMTDEHIVVIGGVNVDVSASLTDAYRHGDSIPGRVTLGFGGVAHNMAHNLSLLGHRVELATRFGDDEFGHRCVAHCRQVGLGIELSEQVCGARNGLYLCVNDLSGDMIVAVAETEVVESITPDFLVGRLEAVNRSRAIVADTNLPAASLQCLIDSARPPVFVDGVSTVKAARIVDALRNSRRGRLHTLKLNRLEALTVTSSATASDAAQELHRLGVENVYITLGADGVLCSTTTGQAALPAVPAQVVNTTGAGDAFLAAVVHAWCAGLNPVESARLGLKAACVTLQCEQAVNPHISQLTIHQTH